MALPLRFRLSRQHEPTVYRIRKITRLKVTILSVLLLKSEWEWDWIRHNVNFSKHNSLLSCHFGFGRDNEKSMKKFINGIFDLTDFHTTKIRLQWVKRNSFVEIDCYLHLSEPASSWLIVIKNDLTSLYIYFLSFFSFLCAHRKKI